MPIVPEATAHITSWYCTDKMLRAKPTKMDITRADVDELDRLRKIHAEERKQARYSKEMTTETVQQRQRTTHEHLDRFAKN